VDEKGVQGGGVDRGREEMESVEWGEGGGWGR